MSAATVQRRAARRKSAALRAGSFALYRLGPERLEVVHPVVDATGSASTARTPTLRVRDALTRAARADG